MGLRILQATRYASECHRTQTRKDGRTPYVNHVIEVAAILAEVAPDDTDLLVAALLHDTVEDCGITRNDIAARFGDEVADLVIEVTDDPRLDDRARKQKQVDDAPKKTRRAQWIKIADKTSNLRSIRDFPPPDWDEDRKQRYVEWARRVVSGFRDPHPVLLAKFDEIEADLRRTFPPGD